MAIGKTNAQRKVLLTTPDAVTPTKSQQIITTPDGYDGMDQVAVNAIPDEYIDTSDTTIIKSSSDLTISGATITAPAGYYPEAASKTVATATLATPTIARSSTNGSITATVTQSSAGYITANSKKTKTVALSSLDSNFKAANIKSGTTIFGITGTLEEGAKIATGTWTGTNGTSYKSITIDCTFLPSKFYLYFYSTNTYDYVSYRTLTAGTHTGSTNGLGLWYDDGVYITTQPIASGYTYGIASVSMTGTPTYNSSSQTVTFSLPAQISIYGTGEAFRWTAIG